jgi:hypothetical protein
MSYVFLPVRTKLLCSTLISFNFQRNMTYTKGKTCLCHQVTNRLRSYDVDEASRKQDEEHWKTDPRYVLHHRVCGQVLVQPDTS